MLDRATVEFRGHFGRKPQFAACAPGRVNLIGEHTDYSGGFVLPIAIDRVCVAVGGPAADPAVSRVLAVDLNESRCFDARSPIRLHNPDTDVAGGIVRGSWLSYVAGVVAQFQRIETAQPNFPNLDIAVTSSVPLGSGLSSSASLEVAVATLLEAAVGVKLEPVAKALLCQTAEHEFAGVPCGIMDQFISVMGREGHALLIDCRSQEARPVPMPPPERASIVVINTNVHHALASGEYAKRRAACESAASKLGCVALRDAGPVEGLEGRMTAAGLNDEQRCCARHVVSENARTAAAVTALHRGDLEEFGRLMVCSHASLRDDFRVSCDELDTLADAAATVPGVFGSRMTGGGFGGCLIALVRPSDVPQLKRDCGNIYTEKHGKACTAFEVIPSGGATSLRL